MGTFRRRNIQIAYRPRLATLEEEMREAVLFEVQAVQESMAERGVPALPTRRASKRKKRPKPKPKAPSARDIHEARMRSLLARFEAIVAKGGGW